MKRSSDHIPSGDLHLAIEDRSFAGERAATRTIQELTFGFNRTIWKDPRYGAVNVMGQYEWLTRDPWAVITGAPKAAHDSDVYGDFRYTLPGSMPHF